MTQQLQRAIERMQAFIADKDDAWSMPPEAQRYVYALVLARRPACCVEIGTSYGHSGLWIGAAAAASGGRVITIDREQRKSDFAAEAFREAGLGDVMTCRTGDAAEILESLTETVDWALIDADKPSCRKYAELLYARMPVGGMIVTDNATSNPEVGDVFCPWIREDARFASSLARIGNGLEVSIKVA